MNRDGYFIGGQNGGGVTEEELNQALSGKSDVDHNHNGVYQPAGSYANSNHTHLYDSLTNKPTIPSNTNQLTNGAGFITGSYDNTVSGLTATDIQAAIDELKALIDSLNTPVE